MSTRRSFLQANLIGAAGLASNPGRMFSSSVNPPPVPAAETRSDRDFWNDWPVYLIREMDQARNSRMDVLSSIDSPEKVRERAAMVRSKVWELIGGPLERTPLNPRVTGTLDRGQYRIENIVYESLPQVYVTANLYLPTTRKPPYPAILAPLGHTQNGKAARNYQYFYQNLARMGFAVLTYDPFGQGERLQYIDLNTMRSRFGATGEHSHAGRPMVLFGDTFALYCAWDGIRGVDYLVSRSEVDAHRLGCAGQSGGATVTMFLAALEPRLQAAAVIEGNSENVAAPFFDPPGATDDAEQNIVGSLPFHIDRGDLFWAFAPKPLLITYTTHDEGETYSPSYEESTEDIYRQLERAYEFLGAKEKVALFAAHLPHGMDYSNRMQGYAWLSRWLGDPHAVIEEAEFDPFPEERLNATSTGQVLTSLGGRSVVQLNTDRVRTMMPQSPFLRTANNREAAQREISEGLSQLLTLPQQRSELAPKIRSSNPRKEIMIEEIQFESEPGVRILGWFLAPRSSSGARSTVLYLTDRGGDAVVHEPGPLDRVLASGHAVCAISMRGLGITVPRFPSGGPNHYHSSVHLDERWAWTCLVLGRSVIGQRVWDTLRAIDYLAGRPDVDTGQIRILGLGAAGLAALMAAFLDKRPRSLLMNETPASYLSMVESADYSLSLAWFVPGILRHFDLPDIAAGLSPRPCWILNGVDANGQVLSESALQEPYRSRFHQTASSSFENVSFIVSPEQQVEETYLEWLNKT